MRCNYCEWRCELGRSAFGVCGMYYEDQGKIKERYPHRWCSYTVSRIESFPFYHVYPGSRSLSVGTFGCNFRCRYCSNGYLALQDPAAYQDRMFHLTPDKLVKAAQKFDCSTIVFSVNEPAVSLPTLLEVREQAQKAGIALGCLTNGYGTPESTELLASVFSFIGFGLKGFSDAIYREYMGIPRITPILRNLYRLARLCHLEVITPVIQGVNESQLDEMAAFLAELGQENPWHVFRLLPEHEMKDCAYPSIDGINNSLHSARKRLSYVYFHNFVGSDWVNTHCPTCGSLAIERFSLGCGGDRLRALYCRSGYCQECGTPIPLLIRQEPAVTRRYYHGSGARRCATMAESAQFSHW